MPKPFKYDVIKLIKSVKERPCLWDKTLENYKDRIERRAAWEEIFNLLDDGYENMTGEEKRITGELILNKWTNIRDTFVKTLKTKMGRPKRKYLLYDHLKFMTKVIPEEECSSTDFTSTDVLPVSFMKQEEESEEDQTSYSSRKRNKKQNYNEDYTDYEPPKKSKKDTDKTKMTEELDDVANDNIDFVEVDESDPRVMNEDEAFFASLLPTVVKYSEDDKLEFRIEVLAVMKKIKDKKKWSRDD